ncbi:hydrolase TatD [Shewanella sp. 10N.286.51.B7]|uniref:TatD family hydrolase n=1 Tax=Shewanella sp. 10N.286.51.B7 TaxID=1880836 RepID=UPI000C8656C0|nr:TatD family hydrolase [Shewanella sp. 10N.286.51.B7]PMG78781.1 hydrolase TatD [Shewanella sp. 10N.286.51.B7]
MIDTHAHLDLEDFDHDRDTLFNEMRAHGITNAIIPGISETQWCKQIAIAAEFNCYYALGIHPWYVPNNIDDSLTLLEQKIIEHKDNARFVALGECGLDKLKPNFPMQLELLSGQLTMSVRFHLPVILHAVKCHQELIELLIRNPNPRGGVIHGFYGGPELAKRYIDLGYKLGIGGLLMNPNAKKLRKTITEIDIKHFLIETDSPSMTPYNALEKRNTPLHLPKFVSEIANLQKKTTVSILERLNKNASQLFEL